MKHYHNKITAAVLMSLGVGAVGLGVTNTAYAALKEEDVKTQQTPPRVVVGMAVGGAVNPSSLSPEQAAELSRRIREAQEARKNSAASNMPQSSGSLPNATNMTNAPGVPGVPGGVAAPRPFAAPQPAPISPPPSAISIGLAPPPAVLGRGVVPTVSPATSTIFGSAQPALSQIGFAPETQKEVKGFSRGSPLVMVLKQIVPSGWTAKKEGTLDVNQNVAWQGGKTWVEILGSIATQYNFTAVIDWSRREVKVTSGSLIGESLIEVAQSSSSSSSSSSSQGLQGAPNVQTMVKSREWLLSNKTSLRENVDAWSKRAGWSLAWNGEDYPIDVSTILSGDFEADNGPIAQLAQAYRSAKQPLVFRMMEGNKTLVVQNQEYEQRMFQENYRPQQR